MRKEIWVLIILGVIIVLLVGFLLWPNNKPANNNQQQTAGIQITSPKINQEIFSPLKITGTVNGNDWGGFEGQVGTVKLLDSNGNQLATTFLSATTDWMKSVISFEANLSFISVKAQNGTLVFHNENPSGLPEKDKTFILPIKIPKIEIVKIKVYFNNNTMDPEVSCNKVFAIEREIPKTTAVARAALEELLKGLTSQEKNAGFSTSVNEGVKIQSLIIENGVAKVDFNEQLQYQVGGSCKVSAIRAQITQTLKQFSTVSNVVISIDGRTEDILQP